MTDIPSLCRPRQPDPCQASCRCHEFTAPDEKTEDKVNAIYTAVILIAPKPVRSVDLSEILRMK